MEEEIWRIEVEAERQQEEVLQDNVPQGSS